MRRLLPLLLLVCIGGCRRHGAPPAAELPIPVAAAAKPVEVEAPQAVWPPPLPNRPPPPREAPPAVVTLNGNPKGPTADGMSAVIQAASPSLQGCLDANNDIPPGQLNVQIAYKILPAGSASDVNVTAAGAPSTVVECLKGKFEALKFPVFEGNPVTGGYPMVYSRVEKK